MRADLVLVGFGNVARRFVRLLDERRNPLLREHDLETRVVGICTRRLGTVFDMNGISAATCDKAEAGEPLTTASGARALEGGARGLIEALGRSGVPLPVVVETTTLNIDAGRPAIDHVEMALGSGCHVVTANKGPAAFAYDRLERLAREAGRSFLFEGAVMDGVPIFNLVRETMPAVEVLGFRGVVNSTTNHIITALEEGEAFAPALARMQAIGIAEADPSLDVDGWDAAAKASALANVLMNAKVTPHDVRREGIGEATADRARAAKARGLRLKLIASATRGEVPSVMLCELPPDDLLAGLRGTANALVLQTDLLGDIAISQLGGGLTHTAYALLSDLVTIRRRHGALASQS
jgi:homoserine dehydrogenase